MARSGADIPVIKHTFRSFIDSYTLKAGLERLHYHTGVEVGVIMSGSALLRLGGKDYRLGAGDAYFLDAMIPHYHAIGNSSGAENICVQVPSEALVDLPTRRDPIRMMEPFIALRLGISPVLRGNGDVQHHLVRALEYYKLPDEMGDIPAWCEVLHAIVRIRECVLKQQTPGDAAGTRKVNRLLTQAITFIHRRFSTSFSTEDVARDCSVSVSHLSHLFQDVMHASILQYRDQLRVAHAAHLIAVSDEKLTNIAYDCGFNSLSHFYRIFKKNTGKTPRQYRLEIA